MTATDLDAWRGVAAEGSDDLSSETTVRLQERSRRLLGSLLRPHRRTLWYAVVLLLVQNAAAMAGPLLVAVGIDKAIPAIDDGEGPALLIGVTVALVVAAVVEYLTKRSFLVVSGRVGQAVLLDLRTRVYDQFQRLSPAFHERYTSGRVISRLTSDVDAIGELLDGGIDDLVVAALSVVSVGAILLWLDLPMGLLTLLSFPLLLCCPGGSGATARSPTGVPARPSPSSSCTSSSRSPASAPCRRSAASRATSRSSRRSTPTTGWPTSGRSSWWRSSPLASS